MPLPIAMGWTSQLPDSDAESTKNGSLVARFEPGENPVADYYYFDGLGSTVMMTQGLSTITDRYDYDAWGNEYPIMVSTADNPYRYVGQLGYYTHWMDSSLTDLLHLGVRFYEPGVGRFSQRDPAANGVNWYAYVNDVPTFAVDPTGLVGVCYPILAVPVPWKSRTVELSRTVRFGNFDPNQVRAAKIDGGSEFVPGVGGVIAPVHVRCSVSRFVYTTRRMVTYRVWSVTEMRVDQCTGIQFITYETVKPVEWTDRRMGAQVCEWYAVSLYDSEPAYYAACKLAYNNGAKVKCERYRYWVTSLDVRCRSSLSFSARLPLAP